MLYQLHEWQRSFLGPLSYFAQANARALNDHSNPFAQVPGAQRMAAGYELMHRLGKDYEKPEFGIHTAVRTRSRDRGDRAGGAEQAILPAQAFQAVQ